MLLLCPLKLLQPPLASPIYHGPGPPSCLNPSCCNVLLGFLFVSLLIWLLIFLLAMLLANLPLPLSAVYTNTNRAPLQGQAPCSYDVRKGKAVSFSSPGSGTSLSRRELLPQPWVYREEGCSCFIVHPLFWKSQSIGFPGRPIRETMMLQLLTLSTKSGPAVEESTDSWQEPCLIASLLRNRVKSY